jgi:dTDP-4-dehydrorhamnose reductase
LVLFEAMKIFMTGGSGMLGQAICRHFQPQHTLIAPTRQQLDITDHEVVWQCVADTQPDWVFHLAAMTNVDKCEREPDLAFQVNAEATGNLVEICRHFHIPLLFTSTIAVFHGDKPTPYHEHDTLNPVNIHGHSKWAAEQRVATLPHHLIVRCGWLFGGGDNDKKFVRKIWELAQMRDSLAVVDDKIGSPTYVSDLAEGIARLLAENVRGTVHLVNDGNPVSRFALAQEVLRLGGLQTQLQAVPSTHFPQLAPRPDMEATVSRRTVGWLRDWRVALADYLSQASLT